MIEWLDRVRSPSNTGRADADEAFCLMPSTSSVPSFLSSSLPSPKPCSSPSAHTTSPRAEPPAIVALQLARQAVTMLPAPVDRADLSEAHHAAGRVPAYLAFMKSWTWTAPLWRADVLAAEVEGQSAVGDMHEVFTQIARDEHLAPLRRFMHDGLLEDERNYLSALAADVLKGGPDPGISVPVMAGLTTALPPTPPRAGGAPHQPTSVIQVTEARLGVALNAVALADPGPGRRGPHHPRSRGAR